MSEKIIDYEALEKAMPNLDCFVDPSQAEEAAREMGEVLCGLNKLQRYATHKAQAMKFRLAGDINTALLFEKRCDTIHKELPVWARW